MEIRARLNTDIDLVSDLLEDLSKSSFETEHTHSDGESSSESESEEIKSNGSTKSGADRSDNLKDETDEGSENDTSDGSEDVSSSGSDGDSSDEYEDEEDDLDVNFELDKFDLSLLSRLEKTLKKFNKDLQAETEALPFEELQSENRFELESCLVSFYSNLREQASTCLYTFYGPKSYEFSRLLQFAISSEERKAQRSFNKLWAECCDRRPPPVLVRRPPPRASRPPLKLQEQRLVSVDLSKAPESSSDRPIHELGTAQKASKDRGADNVKRVWNHITISRDQTRASDFNKELLKIFRISNRNQSADDDNTNEYPHVHTRKYPRLEPIWRVGPTRTLLPVLEERRSEEVILTRPHDYLNPEIFSTPLETQSDLDQRVLSHKGPAGNMKDQPQPKASGGTEGLKPAYSSENSDSDMPGPMSGTRPAVDGSFDHEQLMGRLASLETENKGLKEANQTMARSETVYHIQVDRRGPVPYLAYLDEPTWAAGPNGETVLKSHFGVHDISGYLQQNKDVAFVINKYYNLGHQDQEVREAMRDKRALPRAECSYEAVRFQSFEMTQALEDFIGQQPSFTEEFPGLNIANGVGAPYLFWYYYRSKNALEGLSPTSLASMNLLTSWIEENYGKLYGLVEDQLERGVVSAKTIEFLVKPGDAVVWKEKRDLKAAVAESWLWAKKTPQARQGFSFGSRRGEWGTKSKDDDAIPLWKSSVKCWNYGFDGSFYRRLRELEISFAAETQEEEVPITNLSAYPLQYAPETWKDTLDARGRMSWRCRHQRIASYEDDRGLYGNSERFMIDFHTYEQLHSDSNSFKKSYPTIDDPNVKRMDPEVMTSVSPPAIPDLYVFPNTIPAYNLRSKKWVDLEVDQIRDVTWNKKSFEHLVVDIETKDLIQALITNQIARGQGTDTIDGKGNGLIILLHGGPGTGKTFTAESVAEMAEKPLFRVTCGDIGTKPEEVEKYLESVLHLGKNWGCVVLLDEADVFLEQRTLTDLERNALVSVFLRVLEYYEGILILTSNRVGTFDEAFKSRIQLSLHYENLTEGQRGRIWKNFLSRLKDLERQNATGAVDGENLMSDGKSHSMGIDFDDVECYLSDLARVEMNGRQIRNAITTARQLAKFKGELMAYHHLRHVIKVSSKFDSYLNRVREGYSDDQIARDGGIR